MKTFKILIGLILLSQLSLGQSFPCVNDISTNPNAPRNDNAPLPYFLNSFNWYQGNGVSIPDWPVINMDAEFPSIMINPFTSSMPSEYNYLYAHGIDELDFYPEDGWEILTMNLGRFPDNSDYVADHGYANVNEDIPYVIFYNKYRGVIRLFANTKADITDGYHSVQIKLKFDDAGSSNSKISGLFNKAGGLGARQISLFLLKFLIL